MGIPARRHRGIGATEVSRGSADSSVSAGVCLCALSLPQCLEIDIERMVTSSQVSVAQLL
jgi:hypothetical protein